MLHGFGCLVHSGLSVELRVDLSHDLLPEWDIDNTEKARLRYAMVAERANRLIIRTGTGAGR